MEPNEPFKRCNMCGFEWATIEDFVQESDVIVNGYQASFGRPEEGLFVLTHVCPGCRTTMSIEVGKFTTLYRGPHFADLRFMQPECEGHCLIESDLGSCKVECSMRWVRDVLQYVKEHRLPEQVSETVALPAS